MAKSENTAGRASNAKVMNRTDLTRRLVARLKGEEAVIAGIGNTNFIASDKINHRNRQTFNYGAGIRVLFHDRFTVQMDMRQHIFDLDILGQNQSTKNLEWTGGVSFYF